MRAIYKLFPASNTALEFIAMPGYDEAKKRVDESAPTAGRWAPHPETRMPLGRLFTDGLTGRPQLSRQLPGTCLTLETFGAILVARIPSIWLERLLVFLLIGASIYMLAQGLGFL